MVDPGFPTEGDANNEGRCPIFLKNENEKNWTGGGDVPGGPYGSGNDHSLDSLCLVDLQRNSNFDSALLRYTMLMCRCLVKLMCFQDNSKIRPHCNQPIA